MRKSTVREVRLVEMDDIPDAYVAIVVRATYAVLDDGLETTNFELVDFITEGSC